MQKLQQNLQYLCEEFVQLVPLKGTTTGADILKDVLECLEENKLDLKEALCANYLHMQEVMNILVKVVNLI